MSLFTFVQIRVFPFLQRHLFFLQLSLTLIGLSWIFILPRNEIIDRLHVSESALLPGQVNTYFENRYSKTVSSSLTAANTWSHLDASVGTNTMYDDLEQIFTAMGLPTQKQNYSINIPGSEFNGSNFITTLRAPRGDATESLLLCVPWKDHIGQYNEAGVALAISLLKYFQGWSLWSKDIILVIFDDPVYGPSSFLTSYFDQTTPYISYTPLKIRSGSIQAGLSLELVTTENNSDVLEVLYQATNGQLPNLDLFNTISRIFMQHFNYPLRLQGYDFHANSGSSYTSRLKSLWMGMLTQAVSNVTSAHALFPQYRIDMLTLRMKVKDPFSFDMFRFGQAIESTFRSLNNLLEHLHQSFFFYFILDHLHFISIGNYMPSILILAASFMLGAYRHWINHEKKIDLWRPFSFWLFSIFCTIAAYYLVSSSTKITVFIFLYLMLTFIGIIFSTFMTSEDAELVLSYDLMSKSLFISVVSTLNFSLSFVVAILLVPLQFISFRFNRRLSLLFAVLTYFSTFIFLCSLSKILNGPLVPFWLWAKEYELFNSWLMPSVFMILVLPEIIFSVTSFFSLWNEPSVKAKTKTL